MTNINGEVWRVLIVPPHHPALRTPDGSYTLGCCDDLVKTIFISNNLNDFYLQKVLRHELVHAAMFSYNVYLTYEQEEMLADLVATYGEEIIMLTNSLINRLVQKNRK